MAEGTPRLAPSDSPDASPRVPAASSGSPVAALAAFGMYPFEPLMPAYDRYWAAVARRAPWLPSTLDWSSTAHDHWEHPNVAVTQTCGWPLVTRLAPRFQVMGAFAASIPGANGVRYRSTIVARRPGPLEAFTEAAAAVNDRQSLSGWVSLVSAFGGTAVGRNRPVVITGSHLESVRVVQDGRAEVASIDSVTLAHVRRFWPELVDGLVTIGHGPWVPTLPLITGLATSERQLSGVRAALSGAAQDEPEAAAFLLIERFVSLSVEDYRPLLALHPMPEDHVGQHT